MAFAVVASAFKLSLTQTSATTDAIDTTGANLLVMVSNKAASGVTISDNKSNTWTSLTAKTLTGGSTEQTQLHWCVPTSVGSGHTFDATTVGGSCYTAVGIIALSGAHATPYDTESAGATDVGGTTIQPGSITPAGDNEIFIVSAVENAGGVTFTIDGSFTELADAQYTGNSVGIHWAYKIQTTGGAENPTLTFSGSASKAAVMAAFKAAAGGGGGVTLRPWFTV